jgi:hypothetical protein
MSGSVGLEATTNPSALVERRFFTRRFYIVIVVILFGLFALQLWVHATRTSATVFEPMHILAGYLHWCGDFGFNPEHPPLSKMLATAPLIGKDLVKPPWDCGSKFTPNADSYLFGNLFLVQNGVDKLLIPTRLVPALMSLLLALLVFVAANEMFGRWAAVTALTLLVFEPNLIAHGTLVTPDMPVAAGFFAAVYALYRYVKSPTMLRLLTSGLAVGLTLTAKHSGLLIVPIFVLLLLGEALLSPPRSFEQPRFAKRCLRQMAACAGMSFIGFVLLWAAYGFRYHALPNATTNTVPIENRLARSPFARVIGLINQSRILPESYIYGLADTLASGRPNFIFDRFYPTGTWFYFPLAFVVKTSVALLVLLAVGLLTLALYRERRREMLFLLLPAVVYFAVCLLSSFNNGVRHLLPVYPFFIVTAAAGICFWSRKYQAVKYIVIVLLLFHAAASARAAPNYIAFANDFWGGTNNSYRIFRDSNVEAQQNLKLVAGYIAGEDVHDCWFAAYGSADLARAYQPCFMMPTLLGFWYTVNVLEPVIEPVPPIIEGTVFLSVKVLPPSGGAEYLPITRTTPLAQIGGSVFVYRGRFQVPLLAALSHSRRAQQLVRRERFEEAVADGRKAVELAPDDPRTHFWLGMALARAAQTGEARRELQMAIQLGKRRQEYLPSARVARWSGDVDDFPGLRSRAQRELRRLD